MTTVTSSVCLVVTVYLFITKVSDYQNYSLLGRNNNLEYIRIKIKLILTIEIKIISFH